MTAIDYSAGARITSVGAHTVYTRANWTSSWVAQPNLTCVECNWVAAPHFNSAVLVWKTGSVILPGNTTPTVFTAWAGRGQFVRIDWVCDDSSILRWVGFVDSSSWPTEAFGDQQLLCYGLERSLALTPILDAVWLDESVSPAEVRRSGESVSFNVPDNNRAFTAVSGTLYAFAPEVPNAAAVPRAWSSRAIVQYLLTYHLPTNTFGVADIPWSISQLTQLPDWDTPVVETRNRTVWDVLTDLVGEQQQLGMTFGSDGTTAYMRIFSHLVSNLTIGSQTRLANPNQHTIVFAPDAYTDAEFSDRPGGYDQVICRGARRRSIATLDYGSELVADWTSTEETDYEAGASDDADYATWHLSERRVRNDQARSRPELDHVYTRFCVPKLPDWDTTILETAFPDNPTPRRIKILERLPINATEKWDGAVDADWYDDQIGRPALILFEDPDVPSVSIDLSRARSGDAIDTGDWPSDFRASIESVDSGLRLRLDGAPNHAIANIAFTPLAEDTTDYGALDYSTLQVTVAIEEDRYCQGAYPVTPASANVIRRLLVECGEAYQQIYIVEDTIAGLSAAGDVLRSDGGYLRDDSSKLAAIAQVIAQGALASRKRVSWRSKRRIAAIAVGDLITIAGGATVNAPVVRMRIIANESVNQPPGVPTQEFQTG